MRKAIVFLFVILFFFAIGVGECQKEKVELTIKQIEKRAIISFLAEGLEKLLKEFKVPAEEDTKLYYEELANLCEEISKSYEKIAVLSREIVEIEKENKLIGKKPKQYDFSFLDSMPAHIKPLEEKKRTDNLEGLIWDFGRIKRDIESERYALELDMIHHRWSMALDSALFSTMMQFDLGSYPRYPRYPTTTNYEPFLFTLCTDSKGRMDWTKYGWLKLYLNKR